MVFSCEKSIGYSELLRTRCKNPSPWSDEGAVIGKIEQKRASAATRNLRESNVIENPCGNKTKRMVGVVPIPHGFCTEF